MWKLKSPKMRRDPLVLIFCSRNLENYSINIETVKQLVDAGGGRYTTIIRKV